jgi:hypothetical protein
METQIKCPTCKTEYAQQPETCWNCSYPFSGTDKEKSKFIAQQILKKGQISDTKDSIRKARIILFVIAAFSIVIPFIRYANVPFGSIMIVLSVFIGLIFLFFGFMAQKKPFISILIPLILLVLFYLIEFAIEPLSLFKGILWKALFVGGLVYSLINIRKSEKIKGESQHLSAHDYK